ncbi:hypothetical protein [Actinacidiphila soli]|uniref:hypothetical protein n=1 Tax=Actinacidiphila soli TaxID=2487275 RepID=UPI000FCAE9FB|nr:hypothetical protein [Actinacidiphila soli]
MSEIVRHTEAAPVAVDRDRELSAATIKAIAAGRADSSSRAYKADREEFVRRCAAEGRTRCPPRPKPSPSTRRTSPPRPGRAPAARPPRRRSSEPCPRLPRSMRSTTSRAPA